MPVSRKRKKTRQSSRKSRPETYTWRGTPGDRQQELAAAIAGLGEYRRHMDERRASRAAARPRP